MYELKIFTTNNYERRLTMNEKIMVNDILNSIKLDLKMYQEFLNESKNIQIRQTIQEIRNANEAFQYELLKVAEVKGYYKSPENVTAKEIGKIKDELENYNDKTEKN